MGSDGGVFAVGAGAAADGAGERGGGAWGSVDCCIGVGLAGSIRAPYLEKKLSKAKMSKRRNKCSQVRLCLYLVAWPSS